MGRKQIKWEPAAQSIDTLYQEFFLDCETRGLAPDTIRTKKRQYTTLCRYHNLLAVDLKEPKSVTAVFQSVMKLKVATNTKASYLRELKVFLNWANKTYSYSFPLPTIPKEEVVKPTYSDDELRKLTAAPDKNASFATYRTWIIICLLVDTGMRASSVINIKTEDVHCQEGYLLMRHSKTHKQQLIPLSRTMAANLFKYIGKINTEYLFSDVYGNPMSYSCLRLAVEKFNHSRGVKDTSIHQFRHTFARRCIVDCNVDAFTLQKLLGHSTLEMTRHYCNLYDADMVEQWQHTLSPLEKLTATKIKW